MVLGRWRWPDRPEYAALGLALGAWVLYQLPLPGPAYTHAVGYLVALSVPLLVGYVLWTDMWSVVTDGALDRFPRRVGPLVTVRFALFFLFSAGLLSVSPDGVTPEDGGFVAVLLAGLVGVNTAFVTTVWQHDDSGSTPSTSCTCTGPSAATTHPKRSERSTTSSTGA